MTATQMNNLLMWVRQGFAADLMDLSLDGTIEVEVRHAIQQYLAGGISDEDLIDVAEEFRGYAEEWERECEYQDSL